MKIKNDIVTVEKPITLKNGATIHRFSHVVKGAFIGRDVMIGEGCYVAGGSHVGESTRIQNGVSIYDGVWIGKGVFVGPKVIFTNHHNPSIKQDDFVADLTEIHDGATLCAGASIIAPCTIGTNAMVACNAVVLRDIKPNEKYYGLYKDKRAWYSKVSDWLEKRI